MTPEKPQKGGTKGPVKDGVDDRIDGRRHIAKP